MDNIIAAERVNFVKKPIEAIQCTNFSLLQRKIYNVLLANAANNLRPDVTHRISINTLCKIAGYDSHDYKKIKDRFRELRKMDIEWDIINEDGDKVWTNTSPLSLARVIEGVGVLEYEFTPGLVPFLSFPAQYAKFSLIIQAKFKSSYGLALYENCERYKKIGKTCAFDISVFRKLMGITAGEYKEFFAMKNRVINKAVNEVNAHADFNITPEFEREGREVVRIRFIIKKKIHDEAKSIVADSMVSGCKLDEVLENTFGLSINEIKTIFEKHDKEYVEEKIKYTLESNSFKTGEIKNMAGYLKKALAGDYKPQKSSKEILSESTAKKFEESNNNKNEKEMKDFLTSLEIEHGKWFHGELLSKIINFDENEGVEFKRSFELKVIENLSDLEKKHYKNDGYKSKSIRLPLKKFIEDFYPQLLSNIETFESYLNKHYPDLALKKESIS